MDKIREILNSLVQDCQNIEDDTNIEAINLSIDLALAEIKKVWLEEIDKLNNLLTRTWWDYVNNLDKDSEEYSVRYREANTKCNAIDQFIAELRQKLTE